MALVDVTSTLGDATVTFTYDDSAMKLRGISATNNSGNTLVIALEAPLVWSTTLGPTETLDYTIPAVQRPPYSIGTAAIGTSMILGINWRATLGR